MSLIERYIMSRVRSPIQCGKYTIQVLSQELVEKYEETRPHIVISIREPGSQKAKLPDNPNRKAVLFLEFHDFDTERKHPADGTEMVNPVTGEKFGKINLFKRAHAFAILDFVASHVGMYEAIIVNCSAGISRSAGVGAALAKIQCNDDTEFFKRYLPNMGVYRTLLNEYYSMY